MPRYRFSWDHIDEDVLRPLALAAGGDGAQPRRTLRDRYGARPKDDFVRDLWPQLRDTWLATDDIARIDVVEQLRTAGLGREPADGNDMTYLRSLRNTATLRRIVLAAFHRFGEPADPAPPSPSRASSEVSGPRIEEPAGAPTLAVDGDEVTAQVAHQVLDLLRRISDQPDLEPDEDGDVALRFGSSAVFVRVFGIPPVVRVYAPTLAEVPSDGRVLDILNNLNCDTSFTKWLQLDDTIFAAVDLFAFPLVEAHVLHACQVVGDTADQLDDQLQEVLGGKTFFGEFVHPKQQRPTPGYL